MKDGLAQPATVIVLHHVCRRLTWPYRYSPRNGEAPGCEHLARLLDGDIIWAPAIDGALLLSGRGGDFELRLGQDLSIGYLSHDADTVQLYFQESLTFLVYTTEAIVALAATHG